MTDGVGVATKPWNLDSAHSGTMMQLDRLLRGAQGFHLVFLEFGDSIYRSMVIQHMAEMGLLGEEMEIDPSWPNFLSFFNALAELPPHVPLHVFGLVAWLRTDHFAGKGFHALNYARERVATTAARPLLLWLEKDDLRDVTTEAPDFWAWRSAAVDFTRQVQLVTGSLSLSVEPPTFLDNESAIRSRVGEIIEYLDGHPDKTLPAAALRLEIGKLYENLGEWDSALEIFDEAEQMFSHLNDPRRAAMCRREWAFLIFRRGDPEKGLKILREDVLERFKSLKDVREIVETQGKIADILKSLGRLGEALRIREMETLPVYQQLGDDLSVAVTRGKIADILMLRGQLNEALRIREMETLPVYQRLGNAFSVAVTWGKIADILERRGQLDEAIRIRRMETLPVYQRLGNVRSVAMTQGKIADILELRGQLDEALQIREVDVLPVYQQLGDARSVAVTQRKIADILRLRGAVGRGTSDEKGVRTPS